MAVIRKPTATSLIQIYYIHVDHLNIPRVIVNTASTIVWRWKNTHVFGANLPDEDPDGNAQLFEYHPRFQGGRTSTARQVYITTTSDTMSLKLGGMYRLIQSGSLEDSMSMGMLNKIH